MKDLSHEELAELFDYDALTGTLISKVNRRRAVKGKICGNTCKSAQGYFKLKIDKKMYKTHQVIFCLVHGYWADNDIHHIDGNKTNNRIENLQEISKDNHTKHHFKQKLNPHALDKANGVVGVTWHKVKLKWEARIKVNGKSIYLGAFANFDDAVKVRKLKESSMGFF